MVLEGINVMAIYRSEMRSSFDLSLYLHSSFNPQSCDASEMLFIDAERKIMGTYCGGGELCNMWTECICMLKKTAKKIIWVWSVGFGE